MIDLLLDDMLRSGHLAVFEFLADDLLDLAQARLLARMYDGYADAGLAGTTRAA